jgi:rubrerythrin
MSFNFNADEVFEAACQIEKNGAKFYHLAAEQAKESATSQLLLSLAEMEENHEKVFAEMKANLTEEERTATIVDDEHEQVLYLREMVKGEVFGQKATGEDLAGKTMPEILKTAIGLEKDSIIFYLGIKETISERLGRQRIDDISKEEVSHITALMKELVTIFSNSPWELV